MTTRSSVAAIVLAAGQSTRLGQPKQLLPVDGQPLLSRTLEMVRRTSLDPHLLVLGAFAGPITEQVDTSGFDIIKNPNYTDGQSTSLIVGIDALPEDIDAAIIVLGDQPLVTPRMLDRLANEFDPERDIAVRPVYDNGPGNPVLLARALFEELRSLNGDVGARDILDRHREQIRRVDYREQSAPRDVDTLDDYEALLLEWASLGGPDVPRYCQRCGEKVKFKIVHDRLRPVCPACNFTYFHDPKIAVAVIVEIDGKIVMQRRSIDPGRGKWTFPSGFVDRGEVVYDAGVREVHEEVGLHVEDLKLVGVYSQPGETVVLIVYRASVIDQMPTVGDESSEVRLFVPDNLPELAFPRDSKIVEDWLRARR